MKIDLRLNFSKMLFQFWEKSSVVVHPIVTHHLFVSTFKDSKDFFEILNLSRL